jgi:hypothetical protein
MSALQVAPRGEAWKQRRSGVDVVPQDEAWKQQKSVVKMAPRDEVTKQIDNESDATPMLWKARQW